MLSRFRWYRRWKGGHWEKWWIDVPVCSDVWMRVDACSLTRPTRPFQPQFHTLDDWVRRHTEFTGRPDPLCRGTPICEDWTSVDSRRAGE